MQKFNKKLFDIVVKGTPDQRRYIVDEDPLYFALYYFPGFFSYKIADYQYKFFDDIRRLERNEVPEAVWAGYRESAKTTIGAVIATIWLICTKKRHYINVDSYDKTNAEQTLLDVVTSLQTNSRIISDYGQLYNKPRTKDEAQLKRVGEFITNNGIKCEAFSTQEPTRGRKFVKDGVIHRPDWFLFDDIENNVTKESRVLMAKIAAHIDEARTGLQTGGSILTLGNLIIDDGVVAKVMEDVKRAGGIVRNVPVESIDGILAWPDKYVKTDKEAYEQNKGVTNKRKWKVSLETKRREYGDAVYATEMMNDPAKTGDLYFDRASVMRALEEAIKHPYIKDNGGFLMWSKFNPAHRYSLGADTAEGIGRDANASVGIDHSTRPAHVCGVYADNDLSSHLFGTELGREGRLLGECFIIPEIDNTGYATVAELVNPDTVGYYNVYQREVKNKTSGKVTNAYGWKANSGSTSDAMSHFKSAFEDGDLDIWDIGLLTEMKFFRKADAFKYKKTAEMTRHFDKLRAAAYAWEGRHHAHAKKEHDKKFIARKRPKYEV